MDNILNDSDKAEVEEFYKKIKNECSDIIAHYRKYTVYRDDISNALLRRTVVTKTYTTYNKRLREKVKGSIDNTYVYTNYILPLLPKAIDRRYCYFMTYGIMNSEMSDAFGRNIYLMFPVNGATLNMLEQDFNTSYIINDIVKEIFEDVLKMLDVNYDLRCYGFFIPDIFLILILSYYKVLEVLTSSNNKIEELLIKTKNDFGNILQIFNIDPKKSFLDQLVKIAGYLENNVNDLTELEFVGDMIVSVYKHCNELFFDVLDKISNDDNKSIVSAIENFKPFKNVIMYANDELYKKISSYYKQHLTVTTTSNLLSHAKFEEVYTDGKSYGINLNSKQCDYLLELIHDDE